MPACGDERGDLMGVVGALSLALLALCLVLSVAAGVGAVRALARRASRPAVLAAMGIGQYRRAGAEVARGAPVEPARVGVLRAVAGEVAGQGHLVTLSAALAVLWVALALLPVSLPWPWALARVLAAVVAVVIAAAAVWMARRVRRARRFIAAHLDPDPGAMGVGR